MEIDPKLCRFTGCTNRGRLHIKVAMHGVEQLTMLICKEHHEKLMPRVDGISYSLVGPSVDDPILRDIVSGRPYERSWA